MKIFLLLFLIISLWLTINVFPQSEPIMYFSEKYGTDGEIGISDRFTTGYLTIIVKSNNALNLENVSIQFDKYNPINNNFEFYNNFYYSVIPSMNYIYFSNNESNDLSFNIPGIYRVFLLDDKDRTITSALVEIIQ